MRFYDACLPLLVAISDTDFGDDELRTMSEGFDGYFARGDKYSLLWTQSSNGRSPGLRERARIAAWTSHPRVRDFTKRLCVGSAAVVSSPIMRGALSAIMMLGKPPAPMSVVSTPAEGLDACFRYLSDSGLSLPKPKDLVRHEILRVLD